LPIDKPSHHGTVFLPAAFSHTVLSIVFPNPLSLFNQFTASTAKK